VADDGISTEKSRRPPSGNGEGWLKTYGMRALHSLQHLRVSWRERIAKTNIGVHLAWIVLVTGAVTFTMVGAVSWGRLKQDTSEQASVLAQLSRQQIARRLDADARLAEARLNILFNETNRQTRFLSQRLDIVKAVASSNHVAIEAILAPAGLTGELDVLLVANAAGAVTGASRSLDLLAASEALELLGLKPVFAEIFNDNRRVARRSHDRTFRVSDLFNQALGLPRRRSIVHLAIEPVFDEFGDVAGALIGLRTLAVAEPTFASFAEIVQAGIVILDADLVITAGGPTGPRPDLLSAPANDELIVDDARQRVARCVVSVLGLRICAHVGLADVEETQRELVATSEKQANGMFRWFLILAAISLGVLVAVVLLSVRRVTRGLPQLAAAATAVSKGDLALPFNATGIGEVRSLGRAFEVMLANLRESLGRIRQLAYVDQVTGLANREKMRIDVSAALETATGKLAFLFLDLDRFKSVNDSFGHKTGDQLLGQLAFRLSQFLTERRLSGALEQYWFGRLGGDEFLITLRCARGIDEARDMAKALIDKLDDVFFVSGAHMTVGASIGIAISGQHGREYDDLLIKADIAMYEAKRQARGSYAVFTPQAADAMQERLTLEQDLRAALKEGSLHVCYQPMISLSNGAVEAAEALVRWTHPLLGDVAPTKFIGIAEEAGLIRELGLFVLTTAIADARNLAAEGTPTRIAVNVSVLQLEDPAFGVSVERLLTEAGVAPELLELEITETVAMRSWHLVKRQLAHLRALGVLIAIDDFGTGYSNLSSLARLRVDTLKIDRSLVHDIALRAEQQAIVRTVLSLARSLGFATVAEGVEKIADLNFLIDEGADIAQGFYFSPALLISDFHTFLSLRRLANVSQSFINRRRKIERNKRQTR
jgi:diguanylate cyclase (GGDEF)-like protein